MDLLVELLREPVGAEAVHKHLARVAARKADISRDAAALLPTLDYLRPQCTVSNIFVLTVAAPGLDAATLLEVTRSALTAPDINHLRAVADRVPMLCRHVYNAAMATGQPAAGIPLLHTLSRAWPTGTLSPAHLPLLQLCVISRNIQAAKQVVDAPIFAVPGKGDSAVTAPDVLQYYLTAGRVYEELALWAQAAGMYKTCLCLPASGDVPGIIDAYKRWVLTTLLATGGSAQHPKSASQTVLRAASAVAQPYYALVKVFPTVELAVVAAEYAAEYANAGAGVLVDQVLQAAARRRVADLSKVYSTVSLAAAADAASLPSAEAAAQAVTQLIEREQFAATIDTAAQTVTFHPSGAADAGALADLARLQAEMDAVAAVTDSLVKTNEELTLQPAILRKMKGSSGGGKGGPGAGSGEGGFDVGAAASLADDGSGDAEMMAAIAASLRS